MAELSLSSLFRRALEAASKASNLPTIQDETQELVRSSLNDLNVLHNRITALALFSPHDSEQLADISTRDLVYLFVPFVLSEVENRERATSPNDRLEHIARAQRHLKEHISYLENYEVADESEKKLYENRTSQVIDPAKRRELKIQQFKKEKELRAKIDVVRQRRRQTVATGASSDFELISSLLPSSATSSRRQEADSDSEEDTETEDILREATLLLLRLTYTQAQSNLESAEQELELLRSIPPSPPPSSNPPLDNRGNAKSKEQDEMWKLDAPRPTGGKGPLLDARGKPLRPFTILPAGATDRARLQSQVFQADHRLPTMSIDEYLEIERQRGNIITGGGPASEAKLTTSEQLQFDSEMDGTVFGEEKVEEKRQKDESWAKYTDTHPKGAGNTMNRG